MKQCINCGKELNDSIEFCDDCGQKQPTITNDPVIARKNRTTYFVITGWVIIIVAIIAGIILGNIFETKELIHESAIDVKYNEYKTTFNQVAMFITWTSGLVLGIFTIGIGSICHRLDLIIDKNK